MLRVVVVAASKSEIRNVVIRAVFNSLGVASTALEDLIWMVRLEVGRVVHRGSAARNTTKKSGSFGSAT